MTFHQHRDVREEIVPGVVRDGDVVVIDCPDCGRHSKVPWGGSAAHRDWVCICQVPRLMDEIAAEQASKRPHRNAATGRENVARRSNLAAANEARGRLREARRRDVLVLHQQGWSTREISASLGVCRETVLNDLRVMLGPDANDVTARSKAKGRSDGALAMRARGLISTATVRKLHDQGLSAAEISKQTGLSSASVYRKLKAVA